MKPILISESIPDAQRLVELNVTEPFVNQITERLQKKVQEEFSDALKLYLERNLKKVGFHFDSEEEFLDFCERRIHRLQNLNCTEFYLGFLDIENRGLFIGKYTEVIGCELKGNSVTANISYKFS